MKIKIEEASAAQLAHFAQVSLGINVESVDRRRKDSRDAILSLISATGWAGTEIEVEEGSPTRAQEAMPMPAPSSGKKHRIIIPKGNGPGEQNDVVGGVNFRSFQIKRGVPVEVSDEILNALIDARITVYERDENGAPVNPVEVPSYPFTILSTTAA